MTKFANHVAENVLGTIGAVCWSVQLLPQIWKSYRRKDTAGLSAWLLLIWLVSGVWLGAYCLQRDLAIPLIVQPQLFCLFSAIAWCQCLHYSHGMSAPRAITLCVVACALCGGIEAGLYFGSMSLEARGNTALTTACGVLSAVFIVLGLVPQYIEVYRYKAVVGISLIFLLVDFLGGVFSSFALMFAEGDFDILASCSYAALAVAELGIFILVPILNPRYHRAQAQKKLDEEATLAESGATSATTPAGEDAHDDGKGRQELSKAQSRSSSEHRRGPLGWMDEGVCEEEEEAKKRETADNETTQGTTPDRRHKV